MAKEIYKYLTDPVKDMKIFYKMIVMNFLLKNGDAHLKNFGLLYSDDFGNIYLSPTYDMVTTTAYIFKDRPALTLERKKIWHNRNSLLNFGVKSCYLSIKEANNLFDECLEAVKLGINLVKNYINNNPTFETIGRRMCDSWSLSVDKSYKEIPNELTRNW